MANDWHANGLETWMDPLKATRAYCDFWLNVSRSSFPAISSLTEQFIPPNPQEEIHRKNCGL